MVGACPRAPSDGSDADRYAPVPLVTRKQASSDRRRMSVARALRSVGTAIDEHDIGAQPGPHPDGGLPACYQRFR